MATSEAHLLLTFQIPVQPGTKYTAVIKAADRVLGSAEVTGCDDHGNCYLLLDKGRLSSGKYRLRVSEDSHPGDQKPAFDFDFSL